MRSRIDFGILCTALVLATGCLDREHIQGDAAVSTETGGGVEAPGGSAAEVQPGQAVDTARNGGDTRPLDTTATDGPAVGESEVPAEGDSHPEAGGPPDRPVDTLVVNDVPGVRDVEASDIVSDLAQDTVLQVPLDAPTDSPLGLDVPGDASSACPGSQKLCGTGPSAVCIAVT